MDSAFNVVYPQMGDDATYTYVATNAYGSVASTATVLTVQIAPSITAQPQSLTVHSGNSASLSVGATGTSLQYQWYKNGDVLAGATSATLSIGNVSVADDADYSVQVSNLVGSEASLTVHLTVLTAPIFLQQPASQTVQAGGAVTLSCNVGPDTVLPTVSSGNLRLWLDANAKVDADSNNFVSRWGDCSSNHWNAAQSDPNWQPVLTHPDALHGRAAMHFEDYQITGSFLTNSTLSFHGAYTAFLVYSHDTGGAGFMTPFQMDSFDADEFTNGESHPFSGFALWPNGEIGVITWDWIDSGISMPANMWHVETLRQHTDAVVDVTSQSANAATNTTLVEGGNYLWQSGYHLGRLAGDIAEVIVYEGALSDVDQAAVGQFLNDKYFLNNVRGFGFQWQLNGVDIAGATNQTLQLSDVQASQGGTYTVVVTDNGGTSTSVGAVVTVNGPGAPQIVVQPQTHAVNFGDTVSVFVTTSGNSPMAYQWFKDGSLVSGATDSSYTVTGFSAADAAGYSVRISNDAGSVTSAAGLIGVPPQIVQQPQSVVVPRGQPFQMAVQASGTGLSYCWRFHSMLFGVSSDPTVTGVSDFGAVIRFQTNSIYGRDASTMADNGGYSVVISNAFGMVTSAVVIVATAVQPNFTTEPSSIKVAEGFRFVLPSHAEGGVLSYQWYKNGSAIPGGTQENYNAWRNTVAFGGSNAATIFDAGSYYCVASNIVGTATSATATLTVTTDTSKVWISSPRLVLTGDYSAGLTMQGWIHDDLTDGTVTVNGGATYPVTITYWNMIYNLLAWTCTITDCPPGAVTLTAAARGNDGTTYHFVTTVFNSPAITLQGGVNGPGTVSPSLFGTSLRFGSNYTMTATPVAGAFFTGWSTDEGVISTDPALRFTMTTNLHLYANFVADPFASVLGNFNGLFSEDVVTAQTAGSVTVKVLKKGVYSGTLKRGNRSYGISGKFDLSGHATHFVRALNSTVDMHFDFAHAQITGAITGVGANAELRAVRAPFSATSPSGFTGKYAMVLPASASSGSGHGYGLINHTANGTINLLPPSSLGDGTAISQSVGVGANGEWPVYARVNGGTGLLFGWLNFGNARTLSGNVNWVRPNSEVEEIEINGSSYTPATASSGVKLTATCDGGCLTQCVSNTVSVGTTAIAVLAPNTNSLSLKISSASGFLSGSFKVNGTTKKIKGVLLQQQTNGAGFFADAPKNGAVLLK
ncbi:MAG: immunoglobulin domain-containing protein, partial [Limisphaerales bacterium]